MWATRGRALNVARCCAAPQVAPIVENVRAKGDEAVREYTAKFDRVQLDAVCVPIEVSVAACGTCTCLCQKLLMSASRAKR